MELKIKDIVKGNMAHFSFYRGGNMFYTVTVFGVKWMFPVSLEDIGGASLFAEMKAITLMRYIRKALGRLVLVPGLLCRARGTMRPHWQSEQHQPVNSSIHVLLVISW